MSERLGLLAVLLSLACNPAAPPDDVLRVTFDRSALTERVDHLEVKWFGNGEPIRVPETGSLHDSGGSSLGSVDITVGAAGDRTLIATAYASSDEGGAGSIVGEGFKQDSIVGLRPWTVYLKPGALPDVDHDGFPDGIDICKIAAYAEMPMCTHPQDKDGGNTEEPDAGADAAPDVAPADVALPPDVSPPDLVFPDVTLPDLAPSKLPVGSQCFGADQCESGNCPAARAGRLCALAGMVAVPAGSFMHGCLARDKCAADEQPARTVTLKAFQIDQYEVTHADYQKCVLAGACTAPGSLDPKNRAKFPIGNLTWTMADGYCRWAGKRLPTEAEWEHAARGTGDWIYPWGDAPADCKLAQYRTCALNNQPPDSIAVGILGGASDFGAEDMAGNIAEWVSDWYANNAYATAPATDPTGPASGTAHVLRGGAFDSMPPSLRTGARASSSTQMAVTGVRCARDW